MEIVIGVFFLAIFSGAAILGLIIFIMWRRGKKNR